MTDKKMCIWAIDKSTAPQIQPTTAMIECILTKTSNYSDLYKYCPYCGKEIQRVNLDAEKIG